MKGIEYDTAQIGFTAVLKGWQLNVMQVVWSSPEGANSRKVWIEVNQALNSESISRASIINFLEAMREWGVLRGEEKTGKGGHHWVYYPALDKVGFKKFIVEKMLTSLLANFPKEAREAIKSQKQ